MYVGRWNEKRNLAKFSIEHGVRTFDDLPIQKFVTGKRTYSLGQRPTNGTGQKHFKG